MLRGALRSLGARRAHAALVMGGCSAAWIYDQAQPTMLGAEDHARERLFDQASQRARALLAGGPPQLARFGNAWQKHVTDAQLDEFEVANGMPVSPRGSPWLSAPLSC